MRKTVVLLLRSPAEREVVLANLAARYGPPSERVQDRVEYNEREDAWIVLFNLLGTNIDVALELIDPKDLEGRPCIVGMMTPYEIYDEVMDVVARGLDLIVVDDGGFSRRYPA